MDELRKAGVEEVCPLCRAKLPPTAGKMFDDGCTIYFSTKKRMQQSLDGPWRALSRGEQKKMDEVVRLWEGAAKQEGALAQAQFNLGTMYEHGQGVKQDYSKAR